MMIRVVAIKERKKAKKLVNAKCREFRYRGSAKL